MKLSKYLKIIIGSILICGHVHAGDEMDEFKFGIIKKQTGEIHLQEWSKVIEKDPSLEQAEDKKGVNPFTNEECSGLMTPDTLMRDNYCQQLRCQYESKTFLQAVPKSV